MTSRFDIKDLGSVDNFLEVKIKQNLEKGIIWISQGSYTELVLNHFNMICAKSVKTPVNSCLKLTKSSHDSESIDLEMYQSAVCKLLYLSTRTRPDIAFSVSRLARYTCYK